MKKMYFFLSLCLAMIGLTASAQQSELKLTFDRSGDNVTVNVSGVEGVTATVISKSHDWKDLGVTNANTILCPNVNGNTDPTITWALQLNGVPANYKLKGMGLDIHALNGGGQYQDPADNTARHWNVVVAQGETTVANFADIEISQGSEAGRTMNNNHKVHAVEVADAPATTDPVTLNFTVTKGSENKGCFFGLSEVTLTYDVEEVEVPETPEVPNAELAATYKGSLAVSYMGMMTLDIATTLNFNKDADGNAKEGYATLNFLQSEFNVDITDCVPYEVTGNTVVLKGVTVAAEAQNAYDTKQVDLTFTVQEDGTLLSTDQIYGPENLSSFLFDFSQCPLAPEAEVVEPEQPEVPAGPVVITDVTQLSNAKCYTLVSSDTGRGGMYALADKVDMCGVTYNQAQECHGIARNAEDPKQQFAFVEYEGKLYLYSVSEKKFVMKSGDTNALVGEAPFEHVVVEKVGENTFALQANGTHYFTASPGWCSNPERGTCIQSTLNSHSSNDGWDDGAWYTITEVADFDATEAIAMLTPAATPLEVVSVSPSEAVNALSELTITFNQDVAGQFDPYEMSKFMKLKKDNSVASGVSNYVVDGAVLTVTLEQEVTEAGEYTLVIPEGLITRKSDGAAYSGEHKFTVAEATPEVPALELADKYTATFNTMGLDVNAELLFDQDMDGNAKEGYVTYVFNAPLASVNISECVAYETTATTVVLKNATVGGETSGSTTNVDITFTVQEDCSLIGEQKIKGPGSFSWFEVDLSTIKFVPEASTPEVPETPEAQDTFTYTSASPATEEVQSYMSYITLNFGGEVAEVKTDAINVVDGKGNVVTTATLEADWFDPQAVSVTFAEEVAYTGTCSLTVPAQFITSTLGTYNPEFTLTYNLEAEAVEAYFYHPEYNAVMVMDSVANVATIKKNFTEEELAANAWELHPVGKDQYLISNKATGLYLGTCNTSVAVAGVDVANAKVYEMQKDGIYDVLKDVEGGDYNYLHAAASQNDKVVGWNASAAASHWFVLNSVEDYAYLAANLELTDSLTQMINKAEEVKDKTQPYYKHEALITDASQFNSNNKDPEEGSYAALLDGDNTTFFHSNWHGGGPEPHDLQVMLPNNDVTEFLVKYESRNSSGYRNDRPSKMSIYGGTRAEDGTVTFSTTPFANLTTEDGIGAVAGEFKFTADTIYDAFKFEVHETVMTDGNKGKVFFTYGEFQLYSATLVPAEYTMPEMFAEVYDDILANAKNANPVEDSYSALIEELNRAINKVLYPAATVVAVDPACGHYAEMPGTIKLTFSEDVNTLEFGMVRTDFTGFRGYTLSEEDYTIEGKDLIITVPAEYVNGAAGMTISLQVVDAKGQYVTYASDADYLSDEDVVLIYSADRKSNLFVMTATDPEAGVVEKLDVINMTFGEGNTYVGGFDTTKEVVVLNANDEVVTKATMEVVKESEVDPDLNETYSWPTSTVKFTLAAPVTEAGEYTLVVPEGTVYNESFYPEAEDFGVEMGAIYNPEVRVAYTIEAAVEEYPINFDKDQDATRTDRVLSTVSLAVEGEAAQVLTVANTGKAYNDMTAGDVKFVCAPGATLTPAFNYSGVWMHGYVYVDFGQDGDFSFDATQNDQTGKDLVSYSFYGVDSENYGYNSANQYISGDGRSTLVCPAFTAPETPGEYRVRFKVDWNNVDAGGCVDSNNHILNNGGYIVDATLVVDEATAINGVSIENMNDVYTLDGRKVVVKAGQKLNKGLYIVGGKKVYVK